MSDEKEILIDEEEVFVFPASFAQQRLWFLDQFEPGSPFYNIPTAVRLTGHLNVDALRRCLEEIAWRHETLRTTFSLVDGQPMQLINPEVDIPFTIEDLRHLPEEKREQETQRLINNEARKPFILTEGALVRTLLIQVKEHEYVLMITMHHIISDGWSIGVFIKEIAILYDAFSKDQDSPLPELPIQYADYASWQREWLSGDVLENQLGYWKQKLGGQLPVLELPTDRPRPAVQSSRGNSITVNFPRSVIDAVHSFSAKESVTPFMTYMAAFHALLYRYSRQEDISIGTPIANRTEGETEELIGLFINTLVFRADLSGNPTFRDFLKRVRQTALEAYEHQHLPFEMLVETLQPERSMSHTPLFQVMFILQNAPVGSGLSTGGGDLSLQQISVDSGTATFDITISMTEQKNGLNVSAEYSTDIFDESTIRRMLQHLQILLRNAVSNPNEHIGNLQFMSEAERKKILVDWNTRPVTYDHHRCMHHLFEQNATENPEAKAVVFDSTYLTYDQLNRRANQLANYLTKLGVKAETPVGVSIEKSLDLAVAVLGILKAGGAYVPMDPDYPQDRLKHMIDDSRVPVLLSQEYHLERIPENKAKLVCLRRDWPEIEKEEDENLPVTATPDNMAYMIYTSGSTGKAKGVIVSHSSWVNSYFAWENDYELKTLARNHLQMASFSFDVFAGDTIRALGSGGKLVFVPREMLLQADKLYQLMLDEEINIAEFVPAVLRNLTQHLDTIGADLSFMRALIAGSDSWYVGEYQQFLKYGGKNTRLINSFGLTEASIDSTFFEATRLDLPKDRLVPIGRPFSNMQIYILDKNMQPTPIGVPGEIIVAGAGLARGYHARPDLTAEKFIAHSFANKTGQRMYRTGDLGKYLPDGNIEFLGRIDTQVKLRGFRIELGEIESNLANHPQVKEAAVIVREDKPNDKRLAAYLVPLDEQIPEVNELRRFLLEKLPDYMVPSAFVSMERLPLTPNGKIDRKALPKPDDSVFAVEENYVAPRTPDEEIMAGIWAEILNLEKVGVHNNFFEVGGHSLLATQLLSRIRETFEVELPLRNIFEFPTIAGLSEKVEICRMSGAGLEVPPIMAVSREQEMPLSFAQQRLWFLDRLEPGSPFYNIPEAVRIKGSLKPQILERCINAIIERHEILRTNFIEENGQPKLVISDKRLIKINISDLRHLEPAEREKQGLDLVQASGMQPFHLNEGPLLRINLVQMADDEYLLVSVIHHIISDDWSSQVMIQEIAMLYDSFARDLPQQLPPMPIQYADFAHWQQNWLQGEVLEQQLTFWKEYLQNSPPLLKLPTDRPRPAVQTNKGDYISFNLDTEISAAVNQLAQQEGATLFMVLLAAFSTLLYRYSDQDDINIGTPIANRNRAEIEGLIGFFVNTLVIRSDLSGRPSFRELVKRQRESSLNAYAHQDLPFEKIVDAIQPERNMSHSPLFQVMFSLQNTPPHKIETTGGDLQIHSLEATSGTAKFDLTLFMLESNNALSGAFEFNTDLFDRSTVERLQEHFINLLKAAVKNPDSSIDALSFLDDQERRRLLVDWNGKEKAGHFTSHLVHIFEDQAQRHPELPVLQMEEHILSYQQLNIQANRIAHHLIQAGVTPDTLIGLSVRRSPQMIAAMLGILKSGAAYVPIDPTYPAERLKYMLDDSAINIVITQQELIGVLPESQARLLLIDSDWPEIEKQSSENPDIAIKPEHLAYMIYTSGSTGRPKGTLITHRGLLNYLNWAHEAYPLTEGRGSLVHSTIAFDATVTAVFTPLLTGKTITLIPDDADLEGLANALRTYRNFSVVKITPAHLDLLAGQVQPQEAAGMTHAFIIGGENLTADQIQFWQQNAPQTALFNEYGPTETVVGCVVFEARRWRGSSSVPIGQAIPNTVVYLLNSSLQPVPVGVPGELYIGGEGLARGYLNRPDLTAERFIPDPFSDTEGARLYKTGDLVRYLPDGQMEFIDRVDTQVKIRGYRIELGEIESLLRTHPQIEDAVVTVREDQPGERRLAGYFVPNEQAEISPADLRTFLKKELPDYMIPLYFISLEKMPLTANGKVDRKALPAPEAGALESTSEFIAPRSSEEELLAEIWRELLHVERIGIHDNFFEIGGHSLLATQFISRVRDVFNVELPLRDLFEAPTIAAMILKIDQARHQALGPQTPPLIPASREQELPLSFAQQRLWFLDQLMPDSPFYNIPAAMRLRGSLDIPVFERTINEIVRRHESLRTIFTAQDGKPQQVILPELKVELPVIDLTSLEDAKKDQEIRRLVKEDALQPFRLDTGPLFRAKLLIVGDEDQVIIFNMHHIISDGWSTNVLMQEMGAIYQAFAQDIPSPLAELTIQYADFAVWQRSWLKDEVLEEQLNYWKETIGVNPPILELSTDFPRPSVQTFNGAIHQSRFSRDLSQSLIHLGQKNGATLFMTLTAAFQAFLQRYTGQDEIILGSPIAGRMQSETERLIGFFVNTLIFKSDFSDNPSFGKLLERVKQNTLGAYAHQDIPFEQLVDELQPQRDTSHSPLFQVMFVLQNTPKGAKQSSGTMQMEALDSESQTAKFDLSLMIMEDEEGFLAEFEYNSDLFRPETISTMMERFRYFLQKVVNNPQLPIKAYSLLTTSQKKNLLQTWNQNQAKISEPSVIHLWFEKQIRKNANNPAVVYSDQQLSFSELNRRANQLAHFLRSKGVGSETFVGISLERSVEMVVALLGVLKSGGVYVPIDPNYPQERIDYILNDAQIPLLLTQERLVERFGESDSEKITLDSGWQEIGTMPAENPSNISLPENLAYMIYTSGSTGRPKGTMLRHHGLCNLTAFQIKDFELNAESRVLQFASFSFDASVSEIFTTLISGGTLYLADRNDLMPGPGLIRLLKENKISVVTLPPSVSALLKEEEFPDLKTLVSAGEACPPDLAEHWAKKRRFLNAYGPTENTVCSSSFAVQETQLPGKVPIGREIDNVELYILDSSGNLLPPGVPGELHIAGESLARGYFKRADLTAEKFIPNPFSANPGTRLYRSGDRARRLPDGAIEFLGRIDQQVKIRGFRIELGEIENILMQHPAVMQCVAAAREDIPGNPTLAAYCVLGKDKAADVQTLRTFASERLPDYMVPSSFTIMETIPLTANGKIDYRNLPVPDYGKLQTDQVFIAPRNAEERQLAEIFCEILNLEKVSVTQSFFELGGHSLLATQLVSRIRDIFEVELPLIAVFEAPSVARMLTAIEQERLKDKGRQLPPLQKISRSEDIALSFAQQRLWFLDQLAPDNASYNIPTALKLIGRFDFTAFENSLNYLIQRHETLRTTFSNKNGTPVQVIQSELHVHPEVIELSSLSKEKREQEAVRLASEDAMEPFDLEIGPLFRSKILKLAEDEHVILFNMHHIISDGWSVSTLIREFSALYEDFSNQRQPALPELPLQYADFAQWQRGWLSGEVLEEQIAFWKKSIGLNPEPLNLPTDFPRPPVQTFNGNSISKTYSKELLDQLNVIANENGATLFMALLAVFQTLLYRYTGQDSILTGSPIANRTQSELENIIGFFVNNLVLRADFDDDPNFLTLLKRIRKNTLEAYGQQDLPFENLVEILQPERDMSHAPIFQVMFVMQNIPMQNMELSDVRLEAVAAKQKIAKYDLSLITMETEQGLFAEFEYNTDLFTPETIERLHTHFHKLLSAIVKAPQIAVSHLNLLPEEEAQLTIKEWNKTEKNVESDVCAHQLFEQCAADQPQVPALVFGNRQLTFKELNEQANQLAHYLRQEGLQPETIVGISMERSPEMVISLLAVLKAGGAYVPIDPAYPDERINYIIDDSRLSILITQESLKDKFRALPISLLFYESLKDKLSDLPGENLLNYTLPENLAYIIYTSGSTGKPKGTMLQHRGLCNLAQSVGPLYQLFQGRHVLQFASFSFDASVDEIFDTLLNGATLHLIEKEKLLSGTGLVETLKTDKITNITLPPSVISVLRPQDLPDLKHITTAGESCPRELANLWYDKVNFVNGYGPTENTVCSTIYRVAKELAGKTVPIGKPVGNVKVYILNKALEPQPVGVPGEMYLSGPGLARGYLNRPNLTADRFIPDPFSNEPGQRMYRSGDLVRFLADGNLEFLGRIDQQVKIRGFRIELGEIENVLRRQPGIKEAIAMAHKTENGQQRLAAYIITVPQNTIESKALKESLRNHLPDYMIPDVFVSLETFPLTPNGKINFRALPAPHFDALGEAKERLLPRTPLEGRLADIWKDVLGISALGVTDSFFDLGGHSLLAMKLLTAVEQKLNKDVNLVSFFQEPTIEFMAKLIQDEARFESGAMLITLRKGKDEQPLYFVHPSGGSVHHYGELAKLLETDQAIYGIQAQGLDGKTELHKTIEDMASAYIQSIQAKQPHGPYLLASWSLGVIIVHEMARQFANIGEEVALVIQFDQGPFVHHERPEDTAEMLTTMFKRYFKVDTDYLRTLKEDEQYKFVIKKAKKHRAIPRFVRLADFKRYIIVNETQIQAWTDYEAKPYSGEIILLRSEENLNQAEPDLGWQKITAGVKIIDVPGDHISMLQEPHLKSTAAAINKLLNKSI